MTAIQYAWLVALAALWGASFLFMKMGAYEFGPVALIFLRVGIAALFLLPLMLLRNSFDSLRSHWQPVILVGILNSALPFTLLAYASLYLSAGSTSILNATAPLFTAIVSFFWLGLHLSSLAVFGLLVGFFGVVVLSFDPDALAHDAGYLPILAGLLATFSYGWGINISKEKLTGIAPLPVATASMLVATICLSPLAFATWPEANPSPRAWFAATALAIACTAIAFLIYFHLINQISAARLITVTYLIPFFGIVWATIFLGESVTILMLAGGALVLFGVALSTGRFQRRQ